MILFSRCRTKALIEKHTTGQMCTFNIGVYSRWTLTANLTQIHVLKRESCLNESHANVQVLLPLSGRNNRWRFTDGSFRVMGSMYGKAIYCSEGRNGQVAVFRSSVHIRKCNICTEEYVIYVPQKCNLVALAPGLRKVIIEKMTWNGSGDSNRSWGHARTLRSYLESRW